MLTLQQADTLEPAPAPVEPSYRPKMMVAPVIPENVPLQCSYSSEDQAWHCSYANWFREPAIYTVAMVGLLGFGLGFLIAAFPPVREAIKTARTVSPV